MTVREARKKYPVFEYKKSSWKTDAGNLVLEWEMTLGEIKFNPKVTIFRAGASASLLPKEEMDNLVFHLGLADIFSYWKTTCSKTIKISAGELNSDQITFWKNLFIKGMGQYFFENGINFKEKNFLEMQSDSNAEKITKKFVPKKLSKQDERVLIPVGGGKDSAVSLELLSKAFSSENIGAFAMNLAKMDKMLPASKRLMDKALVKQQIFVQRLLDPMLFELQKQGYLNGHIPFSAYLAFLSILVARLFDYDTVAFSNERSSNESNLEYLGEQINHQYSKSTEFENLFRDYNLKYLSPVNYFSFMRPLYELQIMKIFSKMPHYFDEFRSCNQGYKSDSWCGSCAKCLATFVGLYPFVSSEVLVKIFGKNLFKDQTLLPLVKDVLGLGSGKPFECIGTFEETLVAFNLCLKKYGQGSLPPLIEFFRNEVLPSYPSIDQLESEILTGYDKQNNLPRHYDSILKNAYENC